MTFHEERFPASLSFGSVGGPQRRTEIVTLANGFEERNTPWAHSRRSYDAGMGLRSLEDIDTLIAFFEARQGELYGFRWKDWSDFKSCSAKAEVGFRDQVIGVGDGHTVYFQLSKTYRSGISSYDRPITKPVAGTVKLGLDQDPLQEGRDYALDLATGLITLSHPPEKGQEVVAGFEFDVPVRFATDQIRASLATFQAGEVPSVPVVEIRL